MREICRKPISEASAPFKARHAELQKLDGSEQDQDPRAGYIQVENFQAIVANTCDGFEYTTRTVVDGKLRAGESVSVGEPNLLLASAYQGCAERSEIATIVRTKDKPAQDQAQILQWRSREGLATLTALPGKGEEYFYLHNFDLMWNP